MVFLLPRLECLRCMKVWVPRKDDRPRVCPGCQSAYWDVPRKLKKKEEVVLDGRT